MGHQDRRNYGAAWVRRPPTAEVCCAGVAKEVTQGKRGRRDGEWKKRTGRKVRGRKEAVAATRGGMRAEQGR
jgi:hypothetical protein